MATHGSSGKGRLFSYPREAFEGKAPAPETVTFKPSPKKMGLTKASASETVAVLPSVFFEDLVLIVPKVRVINVYF